jgi:hypothetical protein
MVDRMLGVGGKRILVCCHEAQNERGNCGERKRACRPVGSRGGKRHPKSNHGFQDFTDEEVLPSGGSLAVRASGNPNRWLHPWMRDNQDGGSMPERAARKD